MSPWGQNCPQFRTTGLKVKKLHCREFKALAQGHEDTDTAHVSDVWFSLPAMAYNATYNIYHIPLVFLLNHEYY